MFYTQLQKACKNKGTSITATLKAIGIGTANGTYWKNGSVPASDIVVKLAEFLDVTTDYLLIGESSSSAPAKPAIQHTNAIEAEMLRLFRLLPESEQLKLLGRTEVLVELAEQAKAEDNAV